jgi:hypothetical protein
MAANATAPIVIPAMAPLDNPLFEFGADGTPVAVEVAVAVAVLVANVMKAVIFGSTTPAHRVSAPEL